MNHSSEKSKYEQVGEEIRARLKKDKEEHLKIYREQMIWEILLILSLTLLIWVIFK